MRVKGCISKGFSVASKSMNIVLILCVVGAVWNVLNVFLAPQTGATETPNIGSAVGIIVVGVVFMFVSVFLQAGAMGYVRELIKTGKADFGVFTSSGSKFYGKILLLGVIVALVLGVFILVAALAVGLLQQTAQAVGVAIALVAGAAAIYFALMIFLAPYAVIVKNVGPVAAIKESMALVKKNIASVLVTALLLVVIGFGIGFLLGVVFGLLSLGLQGSAPQILFGVLSAFVNAFLGVVVSGAFMKLYLEVSNNTTGA